MKKCYLPLIAALALPISSYAGDGLYLGMGVGSSVLNPVEVNLQGVNTPQEYLTDSTLAVEFDIGYKFDNNIFVEGMYQNLGDYNTSNMKIPYKALGLYVGKEFNPTEKTYVRGFVGMSRLEADEDKTGNYKVNQLNESNVSWGVGAGVNLNKTVSVGVKGVSVDEDVYAIYTNARVYFGGDKTVVPKPVQPPTPIIESVDPVINKVVAITNFEYDEYTLTAYDEHKLSLLFMQIENDYGSTVTHIDLIGKASSECGICDVDPEYNYKLSKKRALAVYGFAVRNFPQYKDKFNIYGVGATELEVSPEYTESDREANRIVRVQVFTNTGVK